MMNRRKMLIGMGSLAAGAAAATGTGAFTDVSANRQLNANVANDSNAFLGLVAPDDMESGEYAVGAPEGSSQIAFNFNEDAEISGSGVGLNENAITEFDGLFRIQNQGNDGVRVGLDKSGLANPERWQFSPTSDFNPSSYPSWDTSGTTGPFVGVGDSIDVSLQVDTLGIDELAGGTITIDAIDKGF